MQYKGYSQHCDIGCLLRLIGAVFTGLMNVLLSVGLVYAANELLYALEINLNQIVVV
jgi:hypothetical protein